MPNVSTKTKAPLKSAIGFPLELTLETASRVSDVANVALVLSLVAGVLATFLIVWTGAIKEQYFRQDVASANADAAKANEAAAKAELQTAELKVALARLERRRHLTETQRQSLLSAVSPLSGELDNKLTVSAAGESEPRIYAGEFISVLRAAGIHLVNRADGMDPQNDIEERTRAETDLIVVFVDAQSQNLASRLAAAVKSAGFECGLQQMTALKYAPIHLLVLPKR